MELSKQGRVCGHHLVSRWVSGKGTGAQVTGPFSASFPCRGRWLPRAERLSVWCLSRGCPAPLGPSPAQMGPHMDSKGPALPGITQQAGATARLGLWARALPSHPGLPTPPSSAGVTFKHGATIPGKVSFTCFPGSCLALPQS